MKKIYSLLAAIIISSVAGAYAQSIILSQDFQGGSMPSGWSQSTLANDGGWLFGVNTAMQSSSFVIPAHTIIACTNDDKCNCNKSADTLKTISMDFTGHTNVEMSVDVFYGHGSYGGFTEAAKILASTNGGSSWTVLQTLPGNASWHAIYVNLNAYAGNPNVIIGFMYTDNTGWEFGFAIDNLSVFEPASNDAEFASVTPVTGSGTAYQAVGGNTTLGGTIVNQGANAITSITIKYSDGTNTYTDIKTGLNILSFASYNFTHNTAYNMPALGNHPLTVWLELSGDVNTSNDTLSTNVRGVSFIPWHRMVFEEATGTWCGWCPRGTVFMDSMRNVHPDAVLIAVHNADPMVVTAYDAGVGGLVAGYPSVLCNRSIVDDPSNMFPLYDEHAGDFGFADLLVSPSYNTSNGVLSVNVDALFADDLSGNYRLALVVTEDSLYGATATWAQHNYYSFQSQNLPLMGAGHNWQTEPQIVPAANMSYDHVARTIQGSFTGTTGSLPTTITANSTYSYSFAYTVPSAQNLDKMHVYALLFDITNNRIMNANSGSIVTGISENNLDNYSLMVYPNPAKNNLTVDLNLPKTEDVKFSLTDIAGQELASYSQSNTSSLIHEFDMSKFAKGIYFIKITANGEFASRKVIVD